jgi:hypothetical protein
VTDKKCQVKPLKVICYVLLFHLIIFGYVIKNAIVMSEQSIDAPKTEDQFSDILLVLDKKKKKIEAVKGIDKNGELQTVTANKKNESQFMRVDKHGDLFFNFFSNFLHQLKNPTHFTFFRVAAHDGINVANKMQKEVYNPTKSGEKGSIVFIIIPVK